MKTWEMIKELTENPGKIFVSNKDTDYEMSAQIKHGCLYIEDTSRGLTSIDITRKWEEIKKPVDFMTAVKSDKRIWFPDISEEEEYLPLDVFLKEIASNYYAREIVAIITDGEFYIEGQGEHK